jgi:predicted transcriptional regulator
MIRLAEIGELLAAEVYTCRERLDNVQIQFGCASDLMSDVLAFSRAGAVLMTGLVNLQTIQTAFIAEISAVVLVRGKKPNNDMMALAAERRLPLLSSPYSMYEACGILYNRGLVSTMEPIPRGEHHVR